MPRRIGARISDRRLRARVGRAGTSVLRRAADRVDLACEDDSHVGRVRGSALRRDVQPVSGRRRQADEPGDRGCLRVRLLRPGVRARHLHRRPARGRGRCARATYPSSPSGDRPSRSRSAGMPSRRSSRDRAPSPGLPATTNARRRRLSPRGADLARAVAAHPLGVCRHHLGNRPAVCVRRNRGRACRGRAFILAPDVSTAQQRAFDAARLAMADQGVTLSPGDLALTCSPTPHSCLQPGSAVRVEIHLEVRLPLMPSVVGRASATVSVDASHAEPYGTFREGAP